MTKDPSSKLPNSEPSVLDYLRANLDYFRAKLFFWRGEKISRPPLPEDGVVPEISFVKREPTSFDIPTIPWLILLVVGLMLAAQMATEFSPTGGDEKNFTAITLYSLMAVLAWSLQWIGELRLAEPAEQVEVADDWKATWMPLVGGLFFSGLAYFSFGALHFNFFNVTLWIVGMALVGFGLWRNPMKYAMLKDRLAAFRAQLFWNFKVTRWGVAVTLAFLIGVFYRFNMFGLVMPDMISDHAEKLLDVVDVLNGDSRIYFPRNTGREPLQFYIIAWTAQIFKTGITFASMKIGTITFGVLTLPYIYLLGKELGNRRVGLFAMLLAGVAFWPNILARVALRFILYSAFVAPVLYHLLRGLRTARRNDFILAGIFLGVGLHGYTPFRVVPILVVLTVILFILHVRSWKLTRSAIFWLGIVSVISALVFLPLARFWVDQPEVFNYRWASRATTIDVELPEPAAQIFMQNTLDSLMMFNVNEGEIWVVSIPGRPALDFVSAGLFALGVALMIGRYVRKRHWQDLLLLISLPFLMLPSIMALAFPAENPAPNRASGVMVVVFVIIGFALDAILQAIQTKMQGRLGYQTAVIVGVLLLGTSAMVNYSLTFNTYRNQMEEQSWNTAEMGSVVQNFAETVGSKDQVWVVAYPHWVDTRLVGMQAGFAEKDYAIWPDAFESTVSVPGPKMFLLKYDDLEDLQLLQEIYPEGAYNLFESERGAHRDFYIFFVPAGQ